MQGGKAQRIPPLSNPRQTGRCDASNGKRDAFRPTIRQKTKRFRAPAPAQASTTGS
jgi:hypothetical protein